MSRSWMSKLNSGIATRPLFDFDLRLRLLNSTLLRLNGCNHNHRGGYDAPQKPKPPPLCKCRIKLICYPPPERKRNDRGKSKNAAQRKDSDKRTLHKGYYTQNRRFNASYFTTRFMQVFRIEFSISASVRVSPDSLSVS